MPTLPTGKLPADLAGEGLMAARIGHVVPAEQGCLLRDADNRLRPLPAFARDEVTRVLS